MFCAIVWLSGYELQTQFARTILVQIRPFSVSVPGSGFRISLVRIFDSLFQGFFLELRSTFRATYSSLRQFANEDRNVLTFAFTNAFSSGIGDQITLTQFGSSKQVSKSGDVIATTTPSNSVSLL